MHEMRAFLDPDLSIKVLSREPEVEIYFQEEIPWQS